MPVLDGTDCIGGHGQYIHLSVLFVYICERYEERWYCRGVNIRAQTNHARGVSGVTGTVCVRLM